MKVYATTTANKTKKNMKKKFKITLFWLVIGLSFQVNCQTIKTYSGTYEGGYATYQYYENKNYERILNGSFTHKKKHMTSATMNKK